MNNNTAIDYRNPQVINKMGIEALTKELGPAGMVFFMQQYDRGEGNYTAERDRLLSGISMEEALEELKTLQES